MGNTDLARRRVTGALFVGNALASTAYIAVITVMALASEELTGSARLAGVPSALSTVGAALGASALTALSRQYGRRLAFALGFAISAAGAAVGMASLGAGRFSLLLVGMFALGFGRSVSQLSRFAAGDLWVAKKRASAIAFVVWAGTVGSVVGPLLVVPASRLGAAHLQGELAGPFAAGAVAFFLAAVWYFATLRPEPLTLAADVPAEEASRDASEPVPPLGFLLKQPTVIVAILALMISQGVMVFIMTMTPVHIRGHGHGLPLVSGVMAVHTLGMFAISPLTGFLVDRWGGRRIVWLGSISLALASVMASVADEAQPVTLTIALFLLGIGWNFGFVAGSAVLQEGLSLSRRLRLQGVADSATWFSGGLAAATSGFVVSGWSFGALAWLGAGLALLPLVALRWEKKVLRQ